MEPIDKLAVLTASAKYDAACTSSGAERTGARGAGGVGSAVRGGICHSFSADGRCISLLKVLLSNFCIYDCKYCVNRTSNDIPRAAFTPEELAELTVGFYRRNYIEGLFLSSGVIRSPDHTMELLCRTLSLLRGKYRFRGYIHAKTIPGASPELIRRLGALADRVSVNLELPSEPSLRALCPDKPKENILRPMGLIRDSITQSREEMTVYRAAPQFAPAGQSTQIIIGATPESDFQIIRLSERLYQKYGLRRVFYSAYIPVGSHALLPRDQPPPLLREHRLYQADWLLRFYGFRADELLSEEAPELDAELDPKCAWALRHPEQFPVEVNRADYEMLLRIPGVGVRSARRIVAARRSCTLRPDDLKKLGVTLRRAIYFITCNGCYAEGLRYDPARIRRELICGARPHPGRISAAAPQQLSLFDTPGLLPDRTEVLECRTGRI